MNKKDYFVVIFKSCKSNMLEGYENMAVKVLKLAKQQKGFLGFETYQNKKNENISISWWETIEDMESWKENPLHAEAQKLGREKWYEYFKIQICKVISEKEFCKG